MRGQVNRPASAHEGSTCSSCCHLLPIPLAQTSYSRASSTPASTPVALSLTVPMGYGLGNPRTKIGDYWVTIKPQGTTTFLLPQPSFLFGGAGGGGCLALGHSTQRISWLGRGCGGFCFPYLGRHVHGHEQTLR